MKYQAHINLEFCNKSNSIKYLFKYVNKGPDRVIVSVTSEVNGGNIDNEVDEIKQYYDCRYLLPSELAWRLFAFDIHHRWPPVQRLIFHLPKQQVITFRDDEMIDDVVENNKDKKTMFLAWMEANSLFPDGKDLTYGEFPTRFVYSKAKQEWHPRKQGQSIGRLNFIPPGTGELYYMRLLLNIQRGCTSYESLRTVNNVIYGTFQDACYALGLLTDDAEFVHGIKEVAQLASGMYLRRLFVTLLLSNSMSKPASVWDQTWEILSDSILYDRRKFLNTPELDIGMVELKNLCLTELEKLLLSNGKSLKDFPGMPYPDHSPYNGFDNILLINELQYNKEEMVNDHENYFSTLTKEQQLIYDQVLESVSSRKGGFYFVYGYGGTGKTFVWKALLSKLRSEGKVVLNVASSGIASLLLPGGRTAHSRFAIPLDLNEDSSCNIKQGSFKAELLQHASLIIWDEAPMINKWAFEALDQTLQDIMRFSCLNSVDQPFGGKVVVLGGDFRQVLPVIPRASRFDIVMATINSSILWKSCKVLQLTKNMRLQSGLANSNVAEMEEFGNWILDIGDGKLGGVNDDEVDIEIPDELLILNSQNHITDIVSCTFPNLLDNMSNYKFFEDRAILAPTLEVVDKVNDFVLSLIPGEEKGYQSSDSICKSDEDVSIDTAWITTEFLNDIKCSGLPTHQLILKKCVPIMLLRNIDQSSSLCNGTRLIVVELGCNVIGARVVTGKNIGEKVYIPRMNLIPSDPGISIKFQRRQFPISLCFAMTINKSQGQTLSHVGLFLPRPVFSHGQLYVAVSRVKCKSGLKILVSDHNGILSRCTKNVVYKEVFNNIWN